MKRVFARGGSVFFLFSSFFFAQVMALNAFSQETTTKAVRIAGFLDFRPASTSGIVAHDSPPRRVQLKTEIAQPAMLLSFPEIELLGSEHQELLERAILVYGLPIQADSGPLGVKFTDLESVPSESPLPGMRVAALVSGFSVEDQKKHALAMEIQSDQSNTRGVLWEKSANYSLIAIKPDAGVGGLRLRRLKAVWPREIVVRLALRGLESLRISDAAENYHWEVSSHPPYSVNLSVVDSDGNAIRLTEKGSNDHKLSIEANPREIPLSSGYFEFTIPEKILKRNPESLGIQWIDFYRN